MVLPVYSYHTLLGLVVSVGDLTESTVSNDTIFDNIVCKKFDIDEKN